MTFLLNLDSQISEFLRNFILHTPIFNYFFSFFSLNGSSLLIWILVMLIVLILEERKNPGVSRKDWKFLIIFSLTFFLSFAISDILLKNLFHRPRPILNTKYPILNTSCPKDYSFPSTHATTALASATVLTFFDKKRKWFYYLVAIIISYSRIYLGCHYFLDVLTGAFLGFVFSKIFIKIKI